MDQNLFQNKFTLKFKDSSMEKGYQHYLNTKLQKYNIYFCISVLIISITNTILISVYYNKEKDLYYDIMRIISYIFTSLHIILLLIQLIFKNNIIILKIANYTNFFLGAYYFCFVRYFILCIIEADNYFVLSILYFIDSVVKVVWVMTGLMDFLDYFIINCIVVCLFPIYYNIEEDVTAISKYFLSVIILYIICDLIVYYLVHQRRTMFYCFSLLDNKNKWYQSIFDHMNNGVIYVKNDKINYVNRVLMQKLLKTGISNLVGKEDENIDMQLVSENSKEVLDYILSDIDIESIVRNNNKNISTMNGFITVLRTDGEEVHDNNRNVVSASEKFFKMFSGFYKNNQDFVFLGTKRCDMIDSELDEYRWMTYEVFCRYYISADSSINYEFILNDVTACQLKEEKNAEYKYKCLFLSKIAHEFKNPLICINELLDQLNESVKGRQNKNIDIDRLAHSCEILLKPNIYKPMEEYEKHLKTIKALNNYLLILIKDFNYYSDTISDNNVKLDTNEVNLEELVEFCEEIGMALIKKNGKEQDIQMEVNIKDDIKAMIIETDEVKLRQILINLISNSIKFTNSGVVKLELSYNTHNEEIIFTVTDTGVGFKSSPTSLISQLSKQMKEGKSCSLGLFIINDLVKKIGSTLNIITDNKGSKISFILPSTTHKDSLVNHKHSNPKKRLSKFPLINEQYEISNIHSNIIIHDSKSMNESIHLNKIEDNKSSNTVELYDIKLSKPSSSISISNNINDEKEEIEFINNNNNIIIVDDEIITRQSTVRIIKNIAEGMNINVNILEARDGIECLYLIFKSFINGNKIAYILSDENMNFMRGSTCARVLNEIYQMKQISRIPYFILTAYEDDNNLKIMYENKGIDKIYIKPLRKVDARSILNQVLPSTS